MKIKQVQLLIFFTFISLSASALKDSLFSKGKFYLGWGYNRDWYTKGNIHLVNNNPQLINGTYYTYDFTIYDAKASDRAQFDRIYDVANITIPQFSVRAGYYFNDKKDFGIELNYDHAKYVVDDYQTVRIKGQINGQYMDKDTILDPQKLLHFEHTDGANFMMFTFIKRWKLLESKSKKNNLGFVLKPGFGFVYPRTDVTLFGNRINNDWKISGIVGGVEAGFRAELVKNAYIEFTAKGGYANYINALVQGKGYGKASNQFGFLEAILIVGYQFQFKHK